MPSVTEQGSDSAPTICVIGAGFSGLNAAIQLKKQLGIESFSIFEANDEIGGTWYMNRYPGCNCDIPVHIYSLSFEQNPYWVTSHGSSQEILEYMKKLADKYELYPLIKFNTLVKTLEWDENIKKWRVTVLNKETNSKQNLLFDVVINGPGGIRIPKFPEMFKSFKGPIIHSAEWDDTVELKDKVVAVIGNGATGVQVIPPIAEKAKALHVYQRTAPYALPRERKAFSAFTKFIFAYVPLVVWLYRCFLFLQFEMYYFALKSNSYMSRKVTKIISDVLMKDVKDEKLMKQLTPNYLFGCKRFTVTDDYYRIFNEPNVKLNTSPIVKVSGNSIQTEDGKSEKFDVLILCTGYDVQDFFHPLEVYGRNRENISKSWKDKSPAAYYGIISHEMPNHFMLLGPNTLLGSNSVLFMMECQVNFVMKVIGQMMKSGTKCVSVKSDAQTAYMEKLRKDMKPMVWTTSCNTWYKNARNEVTGLYPLLPSVYWWKTRNVNFSHFEFC